MRDTWRVAVPGWPRAALPTVLLIVTVLVLAVGGWQAWDQTRASAPAGPRVAALGQQAASRGGLVTITGVEIVNGLTDEDLGGMSHGVTGLVDSQHAMVRVTVLLEGPAGGVRQSVGPADFTVRTSSSPEPVESVGGSLDSVRLVPGERVEGSLGFVVPRDGSALTLQLADGAAPPLTVDLGGVDRAAPGGGTHEH